MGKFLYFCFFLFYHKAFTNNDIDFILCHSLMRATTYHFQGKTQVIKTVMIDTIPDQHPTHIILHSKRQKTTLLSAVLLPLVNSRDQSITCTQL